MNEKEKIWKDITDYEGCYQISNEGNVKNFNGKILKLSLSGKYPNQYYSVTLSKNNIHTAFKIHRLVGIHFVPNPNNLPQINHKNGNKLINNDWNLEWTTVIENNCHKQDKTKTTSQYIGVYWESSKNQWRAGIKINGKTKYLGRFNTELKAYQARCDYEKENNIVNRYL